MPIAVSLGIILGILAVTTVGSVVAVRHDPSRRAHAGSVRGHQRQRAPADRTPHDSGR